MVLDLFDILAFDLRKADHSIKCTPFFGEETDKDVWTVERFV